MKIAFHLCLLRITFYQMYTGILIQNSNPCSFNVTLNKLPWFNRVDILTLPMDGYWKFQRGGGCLKPKVFKEKYEPKLEFAGGWGEASYPSKLLWEEGGV